MTRPHSFHLKKTQQRRKRFTAITCLSAWFFVFILFASYLFMTNDLATKGIQKAQIEKKLKESERYTHQLELRVAEGQSLDELSQDPMISYMVNVGEDVSHLRLPSATVAVR